MLRAFTLNNVTRVSPGQAAAAPYSCYVIFLRGFSSLLREVFLQLLWVFPLPKNQYFQLKILKDFLYDNFKVARYSFSGSIPPKFEHKLRRHKQSFGKITTTVVLDKDENLLLSGLQRHQSCHSNEMTLIPILLLAVYLGTGNCSSKIVHGSFFLQ